jgi:hypothetical protein
MKKVSTKPGEKDKRIDRPTQPKPGMFRGKFVVPDAFDAPVPDDLQDQLEGRAEGNNLAQLRKHAGRSGRGK